MLGNNQKGQRRRTQVAFVATAVCAAVAAAIVIPLTLLSGAPAAGRQEPPARALAKITRVHAPIAISAQTGLTFAPAVATATPRKTAQQAWAQYAHLNRWNSTAIPPATQVQLGLLTQPLGPNGPGGAETYMARNELAYGYSSPSACVTMNPQLKAPPHARCIFWTFLNADTGTQIVSTYQTVGHWHWLRTPSS